MSVRDSYAANNACMTEETQYCAADALREIKKIQQKHAHALSAEIVSFSARIVSLFRRALAFAAKPDLAPRTRQRANARFIKQFDAITDGKFANADVERPAQRLSDTVSGLFTLVTNPAVNPTNNWGELLIRPAVIMRKSSHGHRSEDEAQTHSVLMGCFRSFKLKGLGVFEETKAFVQKQITSKHRSKVQAEVSIR